jgi:hypothetical protein
MCGIPIRFSQTFLGWIDEWYYVWITGANVVWSDAYERTILFVKTVLRNLNIANEYPVH